MEETTSERKARVAELAKAIKAKKAALDKQFDTVTTEVKKSLTVQETAIKRTRTVLEEAQRQDAEIVASTRQVEETRAKSGVIRRRAKAGAEGEAPKTVVRRAAEPAPAREEEPEVPQVREPEAAPARVEAREPEREVEAEPEEPSGPGLIRRAGKDVTPASARVTTPAPREEAPEEPAVAAREEREEAPAVAATPAAETQPEVREPEAASPAAVAAAAASGVALIKRGGKDVTPAGLTFTPNQPRPVGPPRREVEGTSPDRGAPVPGTEKRTGKQVFELKEMTFGPGQFQGGRRKRVIPKKQQQKTQITTPKAIKRKIAIEGSITVGKLAERMAVKVGEVMKKLMGMGMMATMNQSIDADTAAIVASEFGYEVSNVAFDESEALGHEAEADDAEREPRAPVVTIMGHVDHGKTSLLDALRKTNVAGGEAGGITQHIGAYQIAVKHEGEDRKITFLDTPGHEAFTSMRARGAKLTDIVILVCAVDDGPQPQTIEAINHAKAAGVPIIVALNKVDKPGTDPEKIMQKLGGEHALTPEEWGGETMYVRTSAKTGLGLKDLLESILLRADVMELKANPKKPATGTIVEAKIDKGRGTVATVLVQEGTLKVGDAVVAGPYYGKVRALVDDKGKNVKEAGPSTPVEVLGLNGVPDAGDTLNVAADEKAAKEVAEHRTSKARESNLGAARKMPMENLFGQQSSAKELNIIVKADVQGSVEALSHALEKLSTDKVKVNVVAGSVGAVSESDVLLATASKAIIVGFNVKPDARGREMAEKEHIDVRAYSIIYDALDDARAMMVGLLEPIYREAPIGKAEVRGVFGSSKVGTVAGCMVTEGKIKRSAKARVIRAGKVIFDGKIGSLKRFKDDASEVAEGFECGMSFEGFTDVQVGDEIAAYTVEQIAATL